MQQENHCSGEVQENQKIENEQFVDGLRMSAHENGFVKDFTNENHNSCLPDHITEELIISNSATQNVAGPVHGSPEQKCHDREDPFTSRLANEQSYKFDINCDVYKEVIGDPIRDQNMEYVSESEVKELNMPSETTTQSPSDIICPPNRENPQNFLHENYQFSKQNNNIICDPPELQVESPEVESQFSALRCSPDVEEDNQEFCRGCIPARFTDVPAGFQSSHGNYRSEKNFDTVNQEVIQYGGEYFSHEDNLPIPEPTDQISDNQHPHVVEYEIDEEGCRKSIVVDFEGRMYQRSDKPVSCNLLVRSCNNIFIFFYFHYTWNT